MQAVVVSLITDEILQPCRLQTDCRRQDARSHTNVFSTYPLIELISGLERR